MIQSIPHEKTRTGVRPLRTNAELIEYVAPLYLAEPVVLDLTYGAGNFWTRFRPGWLVTNDLDPRRGTDYHEDFRSVPEVWHGVYDTVVFDPPYVSKGGRDTSGILDFDRRFGLYDAPKNPRLLEAFIRRGVVSAVQCTKKGGYVLCKCMDFITGGRYHSGYEWVSSAFGASGARLEDVFVHWTGVGPGNTRPQVHSRRVHSYLMVGHKVQLRRDPVGTPRRRLPGIF